MSLSLACFTDTPASPWSSPPPFQCHRVIRFVRSHDAGQDRHHLLRHLLLHSHTRFIPDDFFPSSTAISKPHQPEDAERMAAVVPPKKTTEGSISAAIEPFHQVNFSLRHPIGRHIHRPIDPNFLRPFRHGCRGHRGRREIPYGDDMIQFPRGPKFQRRFPDEMRQIPMR